MGWLEGFCYGEELWLGWPPRAFNLMTAAEKSKNIAHLSIGGVVLSAIGDDSGPLFEIDAVHQRFLLSDASPDITLRVHYRDLPEPLSGEKVFESGGIWSLYRQQDRYIIPLVAAQLGPRPYKVAVFNDSFTSGDLYVRPLPEDAGNGRPRHFNPFEYPIDELLLVNFLGRRRLGLIIHALGLIDAGRGLVFSGVSGAGKSTLARCWHGAGATMLSDDRIVIREFDGRFHFWGTPWHGDALISLPASAPLEKLFFLEHAAHNQLRTLSPSEAALKILLRCFPTFYDRDGMANTLELISRLVAAIPCFALGFVPDERVVAFIRECYGTG
jgi:hypothetical protein